ncbi:MAG: PIG-L family deacetylase [Candidatus Heimdallarchaeota archaeon]|nr:PIG-L family deacetylase [Candidatus Heimdallarchaeota archaeon]
MLNQLKPKRVLAIFAHPDDELSVAGTLANHAENGDEVTMVFLTKGENSTTVQGDSSETVVKRKLHVEKIEQILGITIETMDFPDSKIEYNVENSYKVAEIIKKYRPHILITWNKFRNIGGGHPDHRNCSDIVLDAVSYARYQTAGSEHEPYRDLFNVYIFHDPTQYNNKSVVYIDVSKQVNKIKQFIEVYKEAYGEWPVERTKMSSMSYHGRFVGVEYAEVLELVMSRNTVQLTLN